MTAQLAFPASRAIAKAPRGRSVRALQFNFGGVAGEVDFGAERMRGVSKATQNIVCAVARGRCGQAARVEEEIVVVLVLHVGLSLSDFVHYDGLERDRLEVLSPKLDVRDDAFPIDWFVELYVGGRRVEDEIAEVEENRAT